MLITQWLPPPSPHLLGTVMGGGGGGGGYPKIMQYIQPKIFQLRGGGYPFGGRCPPISIWEASWIAHQIIVLNIPLLYWDNSPQQESSPKIINCFQYLERGVYRNHQVQLNCDLLYLGKATLINLVRKVKCWLDDLDITKTSNIGWEIIWNTPQSCKLKNTTCRWFENPNNVGLPSALKNFRPLSLPETSRRKITCLIQTQKNVVTCFNICRISNNDRSHSIISLKPLNNIIVL